MDREEALKLLRGGPQGVAAWNAYQSSCRKEFISRVDRVDADLPVITLDLSRLNLSGADLTGVDLTWSDLAQADLRDTSLAYADLSQARLSQANLASTNLMRAKLVDTDLTHANLCDAVLIESIFTGTELDQANFHQAKCGGTIFSDVDLSGVVELGSALHIGPSTIGIDTTPARSRGQIPVLFLRGCGIPDEWIGFLPEPIDSNPLIRPSSCFISYCTADEKFATHLHKDLRAVGIPCWKWDHDAHTGRFLWTAIDHAIRVHTKLVLIASESSLKSPAVNREIERAIVQENERALRKKKGEFDGDTNVLFLVRLDDYIFKGWEHERKVDVTKKKIADATGWETKRGLYKKAKDRLLRDLRA